MAVRETRALCWESWEKKELQKVESLVVLFLWSCNVPSIGALAHRGRIDGE